LSHPTDKKGGARASLSILLATVTVLVTGPPEALAQLRLTGQKVANAVRIPQDEILVDGRLDEEIWSRAQPITDFIQKEPVEGAVPSEQTEIRFVYDEDGLYVGARMSSSTGQAGIQAPLARRDTPYSPSGGAQGMAARGRSNRGGSGGTELADFILISLDTFLDRRTAYSFGVTASGVRLDHQHLSDSEADIDQRFDPVWEARTTIDAEGWTAEMWIPFTQLRFNEGSALTWGLNIHRWIPLKNEDDYWIGIPRTENAWSSRFGDLRGIESIDQTRRLELLPYAAGGSTISEERDPRNPFLDEFNLSGHVGTDLKMGLGSNLTLDATFFPDFGQVEVDPAIINLTDREVYFPERRPFFTEGSNLFTPPENNYFFSRRVGGPPSGQATGEFVDYPSETTILGAGKVTGRLPSGTSIGLLGALTANEHARTFDLDPDGSGTGTLDKVQVAPQTAWGATRIQQEFGPSGSTASLMLTGVRRDLAEGEPLAAQLRQNAWMLGGDVLWRLGGGIYEISFSGGLTGIGGDKEAILRAQHGSERYLQRPDADYVQADSSLTSLSGGKATFQAQKISGTHWLWSLFADLESPEVTFNDIGRLGTGDGLSTRNSLTYRETEPGELLRAYSFTAGQSNEWNFGGVKQHTRVNGDIALTWSNFWTTRASSTLGAREQDHRLTRGGPSMGAPQNWSGSLSLENNPSTPTRWRTSARYANDELGGWNGRLDGEISLIPAPRWQVSFGPSYERRVDSRQYVTRESGGSTATFGDRYIFSFTDRTTLAIETRLNFTLQPDLNLEIYAQPFTASGRFFDFGELEAARSLFLRTYGTDGTSIKLREDGSREVQDGENTFIISGQDFNIRSFRSTTVLRWEWRPGSTLFLVWQQDRSRRLDQVDPAGIDDLLGSLASSGDNFFALKVSYWIGL